MSTVNIIIVQDQKGTPQLTSLPWELTSCKVWLQEAQARVLLTNGPHIGFIWNQSLSVDHSDHNFCLYFQVFISCNHENIASGALDLNWNFFLIIVFLEISIQEFIILPTIYKIVKNTLAFKEFGKSSQLCNFTCESQQSWRRTKLVQKWRGLCGQ